MSTKQTDDSCLDFDFDKVKEFLKRDDFDDLIVDHTCEEKQMKNRFVIIHCPYTGRNYIYTKTIINGKICVDVIRID